MKNAILFLILSMGFLVAGDSTNKQITGKVQYDGPVPRAKKLNMAADPICGKSHEGPVFNETNISQIFSRFYNLQSIFKFSFWIIIWK